jgi:hypothetical protein
VHTPHDRPLIRGDGDARHRTRGRPLLRCQLHARESSDPLEPHHVESITPSILEGGKAPFHTGMLCGAMTGEEADGGGAQDRDVLELTAVA